MKRRGVVQFFVPVILTLVALIYFSLVVLLPFATVIVEALENGLGFYGNALLENELLQALGLTTFIVFLAVPINTLFGIAAGWALGKFQFRGRQLLITLIDLPLSVSPVVAGLVFVLMFGAQGIIGPWVESHGIKVIFAIPGIWLCSLFVTLPYVARELIPLLEVQGKDQEESAAMLGASGWQTFLYVSLPQMKWALIHGVILCNARVMGEFGAVSVVSGHIRGQTTTLPLLVEILYNEYQFTAAFAASSVLLLLALGTIILKEISAKRVRNNLELL